MDTIPIDDTEYCKRSAAGNAVVPMSAIGAFFCIITMVLRLRSRRLLVKSFWWDDALMVFACLLYTGIMGATVSTISAGLGRYENCLTPAESVILVKALFTGTALLTICTMFSRISIALFVARIFGVSDFFRRALYWWTAFMALSMATFPVCTFLQCIPMEGLWDHTVASKCWPKKSQEGYMYYNGAVSIASDCLCAFLPMYFLLKLQMRSRLKGLVCALFALSLMAPCFTIARVALEHSLFGATVSNSRLNALTTIFGSLEAYMLIICGNLPSLGHYFINHEHGEKPRGQQAHGSIRDGHVRVLRPGKVHEPWPQVSLEPFEFSSSSAVRASRDDEAPLPSGNSYELLHVAVE